MTTEQIDDEARILNRVCEIVRDYPESDWDRLIHDLVPDHLRGTLTISYGIEAICGARRTPTSGKLFPHQRGEA